MTGEEQMAGGGAGDGAGCILICLSARDKVVSSSVSTTECCLLEQFKKKRSVIFLLKILGSASYSRAEFGYAVPIK